MKRAFLALGLIGVIAACGESLTLPEIPHGNEDPLALPSLVPGDSLRILRSRVRLQTDDKCIEQEPYTPSPSDSIYVCVPLEAHAAGIQEIKVDAIQMRLGTLGIPEPAIAYQGVTRTFAADSVLKKRQHLLPLLIPNSGLEPGEVTIRLMLKTAKEKADTTDYRFQVGAEPEEGS